MPGRLSQNTAALVQVADANPLPAPGQLALLALTVPDGGTGNLDWTGIAGFAFRVLSCWFVKTNGAGAAGDTLQLQTAAGAAISNAMSANVADTTVVRAGTIDDGAHAVAAGVGLRVRRVDGGGGGDINAIVYVLVAVV